MINGVNTVDFKFVTADGKKPISTDLSQGRSDLISVFQYAYQPDTSISPKSVSNTKDFTLIQTEPIGLERVHVQRLQTHAQLRNNRWNYQTFYNLNAATDSTMDATQKMPNYINHNINYNNNNNTNNNNNSHNKNIENKSAFIKCNSNNNNNNNDNNNREDEQSKPMNMPSTINSCLGSFTVVDGSKGSVGKTPIMLSMSDKQISDTYTATEVGVRSVTVPNFYRTEDQENAFRQVEDVHNYAKLTRYGHSNESSDASTREYDDEEDDDDEDDEDDDDEDGGGEKFHKDRQTFGKHINNARIKYETQKEIAALSHPAIKSPESANSVSTEETDAIVDIETVTADNEPQLTESPPAHHARRPMNAFLIFCKRHRAIVKDRYKSLENRAITKILGDWWASLDGDEKDCFTKLAQQNKDAFFSAHPNFKWYKLPAPPLRTLSTRPSNAERNSEEHDYELYEAKTPTKSSQAGSYFKLADVTQMGELNTLMNMKNKHDNNELTQCPLQKALGETNHFLSAHMPPNVGDIVEFTDALNEKSNHKRRAMTENSFSSNSSEDDILPRKISRSCKGKIYQELVSSGQIAPITKKSKSTKLQSNNDLIDGSESHGTMNAPMDVSYIQVNKTKRTVSESDALLHHHHQHLGDQFGQFDLEEKIKQLPALNLDAYLQRKRNTKKKKKFTTRKPNSHSVSLPITDQRSIVSKTPSKEIRVPCNAIVGSQKRKARKESITRRDISAIENEVASLIPLRTDYDTTNGCYYFNELSTPTTPTKLYEPTQIFTQNDSIATEMENANDSLRANSNYVDSITTTSDLFILAEVAAKRTELTN